MNAVQNFNYSKSSFARRKTFYKAQSFLRSLFFYFTRNFIKLRFIFFKRKKKYLKFLFFVLFVLIAAYFSIINPPPQTIRGFSIVLKSPYSITRFLRKIAKF